MFLEPIITSFRFCFRVAGINVDIYHMFSYLYGLTMYYAGTYTTKMVSTIFLNIIVCIL